MQGLCCLIRLLKIIKTMQSQGLHQFQPLRQVYTTVLQCRQILKLQFQRPLHSLALCHAKQEKRIRPTTGIQHPRTPHPMLPLSSIGCCSFCATPQCGQTAALSSISFPQFLQNILSPPVFSYFSACLSDIFVDNSFEKSFVNSPLQARIIANTG